MKKILVLEDNKNTLACLEKIIKEIDNNLVVYAFSNVKDAYECMLNHRIDLFLVDIILNTRIPGDTSGLYFAKAVRSVEHYLFVPLIFITSLEDSEFISYEEFHCYSFVEKPFEIQRVKALIRECLKFQRNEPKRIPLFFRKDGVAKSVVLDNVIYVESINHTLHIHQKKGGILTISNVKLKEFLERADSDFIKQCRRNTVINMHYVDNVDFANSIITLTNGQRVDIGITYKNAIREACHGVSDNLHS